MSGPKLGERDIFNAARRIGATDARRQYVVGACGEDQDLQARVEALLRIYDQDSTFLESPAAGLQAGVADPAGEGPGTAAGPYTLLRPIGEGGMGTVFLAEQSRPVRRRVAVKVLKPGLDSERVVARFEAERQALAVMDHPNIAKVLDAGTVAVDRSLREREGDSRSETPTLYGRPYFVMELVQGTPITCYCDEHKLTPRERLSLFVSVCQAVQHAHQKGVIHRDLKPSNVLVALYDGRPVPKVIDFGVAKATGPKLTEQAAVTEFGTVIGTPEYMSPEQADPNQLDIDTRSDVYSLGVVLYELLTGTTPLRRQGMKDAGLLELLRAIREEEPPKPSTRLDTTEDLPGVAANRGLEPKRLSGLVRGELDWIVMKCLEKDRARRYETPHGLARDIERYLNDEPVEASPPSAVYRLRKFARRHRAVLATAAACALVLVVGAAVSAWQAVRATAAERQALADHDAKEQARQQAVAEQRRADGEAAVARAVNDFVQTDLLDQADVGNQAGGGARNPNITVRELLDRAAQRIPGKFAGQERTEAAIRLTIGRAYKALGEYDEAHKHLERSLALRKDTFGPDHPDTLESKNEFAILCQYRSRYEQAEALFREVLEARRSRLGADHLDTAQSMNNLAALYRDCGRYEEAEALFRAVLEVRRAHQGADHSDTLVCLNNLAVVCRDRGRYAEAEALFQQVLQGWRAKRRADCPEALVAMNFLADLWRVRGRYAEAERLFNQVLEACRSQWGADHLQTLSTMNHLAVLYSDQRRYGEAEPLHRQVLAGRRAKLGADHPVTLESMNNLAVLYRDSGRSDEAEPLFTQVLAAKRVKPGPDHPSTFITMNNLAALHSDRGRYDEAVQLYREAVAGAKHRLGPTHPWTLRFTNNQATAHSLQGRPQLAEPLLREVAAALRAKDGPDSSSYAGQLSRLSQNLLEQKRYAEAEPLARECLAVRTKLEPDAWTTFSTQSLLGGALLGQQKYADAEPLLVQGYEGMKRREAQIPANGKVRSTQALERLVQLYDAWGKPDQAAEWRAKLGERAARPQK